MPKTLSPFSSRAKTSSDSLVFREIKTEEEDGDGKEEREQDEGLEKPFSHAAHPQVMRLSDGPKENRPQYFNMSTALGVTQPLRRQGLTKKLLKNNSL